MAEETDKPEGEKPEADKPTTQVPTRPVGTHAAELESKVKDLEDKLASEAKQREEAAKKVADLAAKAFKADVIDLASKAGAPKPALIARLVDPSTKEADLPAAIEALKKEYPELFHPGTADGGAGNGGTKEGGTSEADLTNDMNARIRKHAGRG